MAQSRGICPQVVCKHSSAQIAVRDKENRFFYLNLVYELYNDNKPESKKIGFVAPMSKFPSAKISKTINMLCKHGILVIIK